MAPVVTINRPTSLTVTWSKPVRANGVLEYYIIRLNQEQVEIRDVSLLNVTVNTLLPYTNYSVSLTVCSGKVYNNSKRQQWSEILEDVTFFYMITLLAINFCSDYYLIITFA